jgi:hypothetical protein
MMQRLKNIHPGGKRIIAIFLTILVVYTGSIVLLSQTNDNVANTLDDKLSATLTQKRMDVYTQLMSVDPLKGEAVARVEPWPLDESLGYRYRSGWMPVQDLSIHVDAVLGTSPSNDNLYNFKKNIPVGGFDVTLDEKSGSSASNVARYPFDAYTFEVPMSASYTDANGDTQDLAILPQNYTKSLDTFKVTMDHSLWTNSNEIVRIGDAKSISDALGEYKTGIATSIFRVSRNGSTKVLTVIILLLMITALASIVTMAYLVATTKRPPMLSALTWGAALTFSMIGLRGLFPGSPPLGILIDKIVYFPALLTTLVCSLFILMTWANRDDYVN